MKTNTWKYVVVLPLILFSCGKAEEEKAILPKEKFTAVLIQMHLLQADFAFNQHLDQQAVEKNYKSYTTLFKKYNTDSTEVSNTFDYYTDKQEELLKIYQGVLDSLTKMALTAQPKTKSIIK